ncbi:hypothetical protein ACJIZ3_021152 [Penstemon smallii]|uniref:NB-ARC domain-containing protein n=1 Tax=Penstemon smallii TaxID=265156 RepID=A0ABD3SLB1_9LAMI
MAYHLESLVKILKQVLNLDKSQLWVLDHNKRPQIESILEKSCFLIDLFANSAPVVSEDWLDSLESQIRDAAYNAEDILESYIADGIRSRREYQIFTISPPDLKNVIEEFDSAKEKMMKKKLFDIDGVCTQMPLYSSSSSSSNQDPNPNNIVVGFNQDLIEMKDRVTGRSSKLEVIPITGMGGIGKTTLAQNIYDDSYVISQFDTRAWITISQDYNVRGVLVGLLGCIFGKLTDKMLQEKNNVLAIYLYKYLCGRRYVIVLDDMWSTKAWDDMMMFFPDNNNASRIIVTTRESDVANYVAPTSSLHQMRLLNTVDSWKLLTKKVFGEETCPPDLEKVGMKISYNCGGLPLAIHVIGGILSQAKRTQDLWEKVARDVTSAVANNDDQFSRILSLSYNHLPYYLKPCFLYIGAFPEDYEIRVSKLIRLWVAEGFLKPIDGDKSTEEAAEVYLKALVDRNLVFVRQQDINGKVKSCSMHDLLRDLSVRKARENKFLYVKNSRIHNLSEETVSLRRVSVHSSFRIRDVYGSMELMSLARTFLCIGSASRVILSPAFLNSRLLRVLDVLGIESHQFPEEFLKLVNLRYLAFACGFEVPGYISELENLQTLIVRLFSSPDWFRYVPPQIIFLPQLRHLKFVGTTLPLFDWDKRDWGVYSYSEEKNNIQSLSNVAICSPEIIDDMQDLKKLGIHFHSLTVITTKDLSCFDKLETLRCSTDFSSYTKTLMGRLIFPPSLKKLTLRKCDVPQIIFSTIGMLPNLEILKLQDSILESTTWEPTEGEFGMLQFLLLEKLNLVSWPVEESHFPRLQHLVIRHCSELEEISSDIGGISTLEIIEVDKCNPSIVTSARKIQEEQLDLGNDLLQVRISGSSQ